MMQQVLGRGQGVAVEMLAPEEATANPEQLAEQAGRFGTVIPGEREWRIKR